MGAGSLVHGRWKNAAASADMVVSVGLASRLWRCCAVEAIRVAVVLVIVGPKDVAPGVLQRLPEPLLHQALFMTLLAGCMLSDSGTGCS